MHDLPRQKLAELVKRFGSSLCDDPKRCEALLRDVCPDCRLEVSVLVNATREGVGKELRTVTNDKSFQVLSQQLRCRLQENLWLTEDVAEWAVDTWAFALGRGQRRS